MKTLALYNVPFNSTSTAYAFQNCYGISIIQGLNLSDVTNMHGTFYQCSNLNQNIQIPNSVTDMMSTFERCYNFNQNIQIPNSVTEMDSTFCDCVNLNQNIQIPNSVVNMNGVFNGCRNYEQDIYMLCSGCTNLINANCAFSGTKVNNAYETFYGCTNLIDGNAFQNCSSLLDMHGTFGECSSLNQNIPIPNSVTSMAGTFYGCSN